MIRRQRLPASPNKRRTTLTLPTEVLRLNISAERDKEVLNAYRKPFSGFSNDEIAILDGVILEPVAGHQKA